MKPGEPEVVEVSLFEAHQTVYPRAVSGLYSRWRWLVVWATQLVFYGLPWLTWNARQAVLFDLEARRFFIFGLVLYPQDFIFLTGLLVMSALSLFLFTAVAGRLWCGFACPQTVYTEIFMWIERHVEGDRAARMRLDQQPWGGRKLALKAAKHGLWLAVALWTGLTFVGYFTPIRTLVAEVAALSLGAWETFWLLFYGFATYGNAGFMREQVCKYMCPYARFQSAMFDRDTLIVSYDGGRGEPRGSRGRKVDPKAQGLGDCIDCGLCVQVCPTGIDIRKGLQYECIGCGSCVDVCDEVMTKMAYPIRLISYTTQSALARGDRTTSWWRHALRPRTIVYGSILAVIFVGWATGLAMRTPFKVNVLRDRNSLGRVVEGGAIENVYRLQLSNAAEQPRRLHIAVSGLDGIVLTSPADIEVGPAADRGVPMDIRVPAGAVAPGSHKIDIAVSSEDGAHTVHERAVFVMPR